MHYITLLAGFLLSILSLNAEDTHDCEILYRSSHYLIKDNKLTLTDSISLQINNRDGENQATISIPYSKGDKISIGEAWIEDMQGNIIRKLRNKEILDRSYISNISLYEDDFVKEFSLKHNQYPYIIKYSYKIIYPRFLQIATFDYTQRQIPVKEAIVSVETPPDFKIKYQQKNITDPEIIKSKESTIYKWIFSFLPQKKERYGTVNDSQQPILSIVPLNFNYGVSGSFENWNTFGNWIYRLNQNRDILPETEKLKIDELLKNGKDKKDKIRTLYHYLQDYNRYINVSLNIGGLQTYPADYVTTNHYGDCKALTNYMLSILKYAGIESFYTLINSDTSIKDIDTTFAHQAFNHVILTVPLEEDTLFIECTSKTLPLGYIHSSIQGRKALLITENNSRLINIPTLSDSDVLCNTNIEAQIDANANNTGIISAMTTLRGIEFEEMNYIVSNKNKSAYEKYIISNIIPKTIDQPTINIGDIDRDSLFIKIKAQGQTSYSFKKIGKNIAITPINNPIPTLESIENRKRGIQIDYPTHRTENHTYEILNESISKIPDNITIISPYGNYTLKFDKDGSKLHIQKSFLIRSGRYTIDEYADFFDFIKKIRNIETKKYYIEIL